MNHFALLLGCILSVEVFIRFNFLSLIDSIFRITKKVNHVISNKSISDHWKELVIPKYALKIMKFSLQILGILLGIFGFFITFDFILDDFLVFIFSLVGIAESLIFAFGYAYTRKLVVK